MAADPRGRWFRVYAVQLRRHEKFRDLNHAELGAWTDLRAAVEVMGGDAFVDREDALRVLRRRETSRSKCSRLLDRLIGIRLLDDLGAGGIAIHDLADHDRQRYPSDEPDQVRERVRLHRARMRSPIFERDAYTCRYCGATPDRKALVPDHVIPKVQGGTDDTENLVTSCYSCNAAKGGRTLEQAGMRLRPIPSVGNDVTAVTEISVTKAHARQSRAEADTEAEAEPAAEPAADAMLASHELPSESDSATLACRQLFDSGKWLGDREYVAAWEDMDRRYSADWVQTEIAPAFAACLERRGKVLPWDLKRMAESRLAERSRAEERDRERRQAEADQRRHAPPAAQSPEERERQSLIRRAVGVWIRGGRKGEVPEQVDELRDWLAANEQHGAPA
jgi:hypothetical protein